ncbi:MAG: DUF502 domain-containing protein [Chromatiales bacterium]
MKSISRTFLTGLVTILPVVLTLYLLYWLVVSMESVLGTAIRLLLPDDLYHPGMGVVAGVLVVFLMGLLMHAYVVRWLFAKGEAVFYHLPLINSVYRATRDFFNFISSTTEKEFEQVVAVTIGETELIGFVTRAVPDGLPEGFRGNDKVLVYLPLSYMIGGYTVLMPRSRVRPVEMTMEEAMRFTLTAGVKGPDVPV